MAQELKLPGAQEQQKMRPAVPLSEVGLSEDEYAHLVFLLGREPNAVELGMAGAMWSEHCGYKNSRPLLKRFPTSGPRVLQGPGENAGAVDIGDGLAVVFKIESHNHPSAVEPVQGAATGVGGIVRDIFTMGARPIALLNSLRFGPLREPRNRYLFGGVVAGIGGYGNCIGVPTVGGEIFFDPSYSGNPLVNAMCAGIIKSDELMRAKASGVGNPVILAGADTGRDGIHGATFASDTLDAENEAKRPAVQVGNPFLEKCLIEACLELLQTGIVAGMQDLGAAGLTSSTVEAASRGGSGVRIDVARVPRREQGMSPYEVMLSESQERMLVVVNRGREARAIDIFRRWGLHADVIGEVTDSGLVQVYEGEKLVAEVPAEVLTDQCPTYTREGVRGADIDRIPSVAEALGGAESPRDLTPALLRLLAAPNIASKERVYRTYDHTIQTNTVVAPGAGDAAVLRVKGTRKGIALTTDANARFCYVNPRRGGALAVAEAARNLVCVGAEPLAVTDCLNFGDPTRPEIYYQLQQAIEGMAEACEALGTPVVSGNVSLYNETEGVAVLPTPIVGMLGLLEDVERRATMAWPAGAVLALAGGRGQGAGGRGQGDETSYELRATSYELRATGTQHSGGAESRKPKAESQELELLGASEYLATLYGVLAGETPEIDLHFERAVQQATLRAIRQGLALAAHDCSEGGLAVAVAEGCIAGSCGADLDLTGLAGSGARPDVLLFNEMPSRIVLACVEADWPRLEALYQEAGVSIARLGTTGGERILMRRNGEAVVDLDLAPAAEAWRNGLDIEITAVSGQQSTVSVGQLALPDA